MSELERLVIALSVPDFEARETIIGMIERRDRQIAESCAEVNHLIENCCERIPGILQDD